LRATLHGCGGDRQGVLTGFQQQPNINKLSRLQGIVAIFAHRLHSDGGGGLVDDVVDEFELAGRQ